MGDGYIHGSVLSCHDLCYSVDVKGKGCCGKSTEKKILRNIDATFTPGMNAILGPTGSGKSSLLDTLADRKDPRGLSGTLLVDGRPQPKNFKCMTGYVVQDDTVMGTLSIRENFMFSANLRLPASVGGAEKRQRVDDIISELGLVSVADSRVGTEFIRGVSGGERKRTNIGMELIISPSVLFLDEPTTGLDSSTANAVLLLLQQLARRGRTVVFSIHQPRYSIFKLFDRLTLLALGHTVYHGPAHDALDYFSSIGYECEAHNNPPDFFLDVINGDSSAVQGKQQADSAVEKITISHMNGKVQPSNGAGSLLKKRPDYKLLESGSMANLDAELVEMEKGEGGAKEEDNLASRLADLYRKSKWSAQSQAELQPIMSEYEKHVKNGTDTAVVKGEYATAFGTQLSHVSARTLKNLVRNPQTSIMQTAIMVIFGLIVGVIYFDLKRDEHGLQNRVGAFFFITMNMVFGNLSSVELFIKERVIFIHENASGFYRVSSYYLSKVLCDTLPARIVPTSVFSLIAYFMVGLDLDAGKFFTFLLTLILTGLAAASIGFCISATVRVFAIANLLIALSFVFMMVFSGLLINLESITVYLRWIQWISIFRYGLNALSINELKDMEFCVTKIMNGTSLELCNPEAGNDYLTNQGIAFATSWDLYLHHMALFLISIFFLGLTYVQLRRINKLK